MEKIAFVTWIFALAVLLFAGIAYALNINTIDTSGLTVYENVINTPSVDVPTYIPPNIPSNSDDDDNVREPSSIDIVFSGDASNVLVNTETKFYVELKDGDGNPVSGKRVKVYLQSEGLTRPVASLEVGSDDGVVVYGVTDSRGRVSGVFKSGSEAMKYVMVAQYNDNIVDNLKIAVVSGSNGSGQQDGSGSSSGSSSRGGAGDDTSESRTGIYVVSITNPAKENAEPVVEPNKPEESTQNATLYAGATPLEIEVSHPKKVYVGDTITISISSYGKPVANREVLVKDPIGKKIILKTGTNGKVSLKASIDGTYVFSISDVSGQFSVVAVNKSVQQSVDNKPLDITAVVAAFFGNGSLPIVAVLAVILILIVGVGVYFLTQKEVE